MRILMRLDEDARNTGGDGCSRYALDKFPLADWQRPHIRDERVVTEGPLRPHRSTLGLPFMVNLASTFFMRHGGARSDTWAGLIGSVLQWA